MAVLTGAGGNFCAGMDLKAFAAGEIVAIPGRGIGFTERPPKKPIISAVEGYALAGGTEVVLATDLVVASRVTPVKEFMRTATADTAVRGVPIAAGESVLLSFASANRDDDVFAQSVPVRHRTGSQQAHSFRLRRTLLPWCGIGPRGGEQLLHRAVAALGVGAADRSATTLPPTFVGGLKHLPIRYSLNSG